MRSSRRPHKVRDDGRNAGVEADHVQHPAVVRVGQGAAVGGHLMRVNQVDTDAADLGQALEGQGLGL